MKEYLDDSWCILLINYPPRFLEAFKPQSLQGMIFTATTKPYPWPNVSDTGFNRIQHASLIFRLFEVKLQTSPPTGAWKVTDTRTEPTEFDITVFLSTIRLRTWQTLDEENRRSNRVPIFFLRETRQNRFSSVVFFTADSGIYRWTVALRRLISTVFSLLSSCSRSWHRASPLFLREPHSHSMS